MSNQLEELKQLLQGQQKKPSGRRRFDPAFKSKVVQIYKQGLASSSEIVKELELSTSTLSEWARKKSSKIVSKNEFKEIKITDRPSGGSGLEIHFSNKVVIKNVDWGYVEKMILTAVGL